MKHWFEDAAAKDTSCVIPQSCFCANSSIISTVQQRQRFIPGKSMAWRRTLPLRAHVHTVQLGSAVQTEKSSVSGRGKSLAMLNQCCFIAFAKLMCCWLQTKAVHHFGVIENLLCWAPAAVKESSSPQGHRYTINNLFTKTKCSRLAVLQSLVIKVIYLYEVFRLLKALQVNNRIKE